MQIQFLGAAGTVTGSCYFLTSNSGQSIFIDCGMFQGTPDLEKLNTFQFDCDVASAIGLVLTHAHLDHCGRLPRLLNQGFNAPMWMTPPTKEMTEISLLDSAKIGKYDKSKTPLYDKDDVEKTFELFKTVEYGEQFSIGDFSIIMRDAGHILGSASLEIIDQSSTQNQKIIFSGDLGNTPQDLIKPTELIDSGDIVVMESTYGDRTHPIEDPIATLQREIEAVERSGGTLLIPAFSIQRSQELLHKIFHLKQQGKIKPETPIFFDSPMGQKINRVFEEFTEYYNEEFAQDLSVNNNPFSFLSLHILDKPADRERVEQNRGPKVIIAGSGMMTGGRIMGYAIDYLAQESTRLFIVGFQAEGTLGRLLAEGNKTVHIQGVPVIVNATITQIHSMSSHADQPKLLHWLQHIQSVKTVFLLHGEDVSRQILAERITQDLQIKDVQLPAMNQIVNVE